MYGPSMVIVHAEKNVYSHISRVTRQRYFKPIDSMLEL